MNRAPVSHFYTVGHSTRSWREFLAVLRSADVAMIADIRRFPVSRRNPHFSRNEMREALDAAGIGYRHFGELGGYRDDDKSRTGSNLNNGFPPGFLRNYADYARTEPFRAALSEFYGALVPATAMLCAEKDWRDCHRRIVVDYAIAAGYSVTHIVDDCKIEPAALTQFARIDGDGLINYKGKDEQLKLI